MDQERAAIRRRGEGVIMHDGYLFVVKKTINTIRYLKCKLARHSGCPASIKLLAGDIISVINPRHNHASDPQDQCEMEFREELMEACISETGRLKTVYDCIALRNPEGARNVPYNSIRSTMARRRRTTTPNIPEIFTQLGDIFESESNDQQLNIFENSKLADSTLTFHHLQPKESTTNQVKRSLSDRKTDLIGKLMNEINTIESEKELFTAEKILSTLGPILKVVRQEADIPSDHSHRGWKLIFQ